MAARNDESEHPHPHKRGIWESRRNARACISNIPDHVSKNSILYAGEVQRQGHVYLIDYAGGIEPYTDALGELWGQALLTCKVPPQQGRVDKQTDIWGEYDAAGAIADVQWVEQPISLARLRPDWRESNECAYTVYVDGEEVRRERLVYHLSPRALSRCLAQLDKCARQLGWLPDLGGMGYRASGSEAMTHE